MTIHCRVIAFLSADTSRDLVTLTFALLTLNSCHLCWVMWPTLPPSMKTLRLSVLELRVITFPIGYHWKCVCSHCACSESRDSWVGGEKRWHFWNPRPRFAYSLYNFGGSTMNIIKIICENNARPVLKNVWDSAHARNHVICLRWPKCLICSRSRRRRFTVLDFKSWAFSLIYGHFQQHLYCACAETVIFELPV